MSNDIPWDALSDPQRELVRELPADSSELAEKFGVSKSAIHSRVQRVRRKGVEVSQEETGGMYRIEDKAAEHPHRDRRTDVSIPDGFPSEMKEGMTYGEMADQFGLSKAESQHVLQQMRQEGFTVDFKIVDSQSGRRMYYIPTDRDKRFEVGNGDGHYRFALISDTHLGSVATHLDELEDFYDRLEDHGIDTVYHAGDISDGWKVHKGHINVVKGEASGWGRLLDHIVRRYPKRDDIDTLFIEGNHDHKYHRRNGVHFGELIDERRDDLHYCGDSQATFIFDRDHDIDLELIHPSGGKPYTAGYRMQTLFRERPMAQRPTIAGIGHLHGSMFAHTEGVWGFYAGAWKGTTTWGKRKGHQSNVGGWIVDIQIERGELRSIVPKWVGYESDDKSTAYTSEEIQSMTDR